MKIRYVVILWLFFSGLTALGQNALVFKGTVKCYIAEDERSTRGAKNVIVIPGFIPKKSGMTGEQGYFELNTSLPIEKLLDKQVMLYFVSNCSKCEKKVSVFISMTDAKLIRRNPEGNLYYITIPTIKMDAGCKQTELDPLKSDDMLNNVVNKAGEDLDKASVLNTLTGSPSLLNFATKAIIAPAIPGSGMFRTTSKYPSPRVRIHGYGNFLYASPMLLTGNPGFNFAPVRDRAEAVFWNPSAMSDNAASAGVGAFTNFKNNAKLSFFKKVGKKITLGAGGLYTQQQEYGKIIFPNLGIFTGNPTGDTVTHLITLREFSAFASGSYRFNEQLSVGLAIKSIWQQFNVPNILILSQSPDIDQFIDSNFKTQRFDADLSITWSITPTLRLGLNAMNLLGSKLYADNFAPDERNKPYRSLRSLGAGLNYTWRRFCIGADALFTKDSLFEVTTGVNYVPFNNALISAGYAIKQKGYTLGFRWKQFQITYIDDNGYMINDKNPGKSGILNGRIYTGAIFDF